MNRYTMQGVVADAVCGRKVVVVGGADATDQMFREIKHAAGASVEKSSAANGRQRLHFHGGGEIWFILGGRRAGLCGLAADVVFITRPYAYDPDLVDESATIVAASQYGEVIRE